MILSTIKGGGGVLLTSLTVRGQMNKDNYWLKRTAKFFVCGWMFSRGLSVGSSNSSALLLKTHQFWLLFKQLKYSWERWIDQHDTSLGHRKHPNSRQESNSSYNERLTGTLSTKLRELMESKIWQATCIRLGSALSKVVVNSDRWITTRN